MKIRLQTAGLRTLTARSRKRVQQVDSAIRSVLQEKGAALEQTFTETIHTFTPGPVQDLKPETKKRKTKQGNSVYPILVAFGDMLSSITSRVRKSRKGAWVLSVDFGGVDRSGVRNAVKAAAHIAGNGSLPSRDFTKLPKTWSASLFNSLRGRIRKL